MAEDGTDQREQTLTRDDSIYKHSQNVHKYEKGRGLKCRSWLLHCLRFFTSGFGADWIFLMLLGFVMALISFLMDIFVFLFIDAHRWIYHVSGTNVFLQYLAWVIYSAILMCFAAGFTNVVAIQAAGSGIPEMKTVLRGVVLKEYLTFKTLVAKVISLICVLGSELPVGKEGPFVHIGSICAALLCKFMSLFSSIYKNELRNLEMITTGCAVGIGCCFGAPIGGVLFSIEVTSTFFVVRNYWRGLVSSTFGAFIFRLLPVWNKEEETIVALYPTKYRQDFPFDLQEIPAFALLGIACGFGGAFFVYLNGQITRTVKKLKTSNNFLMKNCFLYSCLVSLLISTLTFPPGFGQFMAGQLTQRDSLISFFDNRTWAKEGIVQDFADDDHLAAWKNPHANVFIVLAIFVAMKFWMSALSITLPIPCGSFVPVFVIGAAFGRLVGEGLAMWFPEGINSEDGIYPIVPGAYAVVGAAALTAGITHTFSTAVIMMELTGQLSYSLPILIAVILSNMIAQSLQPSIYDSIIRIKKLPYLPELGFGHQDKYNVHVEDFMVGDVRYVSLNSTYRKIHEILRTGNHKTLPVVKSTESMILLGSIERAQLHALLKQQLQHLQEHPQPERKRVSVAGTTSIKEGVHKVTHEVRFQISTEDSSPTPAHPVSSGPLKPALKRSSVAKTSTDIPADDDSSIGLTNMFFARPQTDTVEDDSDAEENRILCKIEEWEEQQLDEQVNFNNCKIDPAPFQLVEHTSLHKTHTVFSLLGLERAYVTSIGRLIGVVSLKELRKAIEGSTMKGPKGVQLRPSLARLRDTANGSRGEDTELHKLLDHQTS
ncbi:chloride channel protein 2-like [Xyrauchen texanus]|uniref:chloride channel protein 2-like n=1 Tax=Xyrauchen texanus TaxID=154827 RepID=UPI002241EB7A|nr:chloride channel protein 2-like [Xyrauchen texanus]